MSKPVPSVSEISYAKLASFLPELKLLYLFRDVFGKGMDIGLVVEPLRLNVEPNGYTLGEKFEEICAAKPLEICLNKLLVEFIIKPMEDFLKEYLENL